MAENVQSDNNNTTDSTNKNEKKRPNHPRYEVLDEFKYPTKSDAVKENYIKNRIEKQIKWYDVKSVKYRNTYRGLMIATIILNASIPLWTFFTGANDDFLVSVFKVIIILCGIIAGVITSIMGVYSYNDIWSKYRINCEMLKSILHRYQTGSDEFTNLSENARFKLLVSKSESYLIEEYKKEVQLFSRQETSSNDNGFTLPESEKSLKEDSSPLNV